MKRFLICVIALLILVASGSYLVFQKGFYLDLAPDTAVTASFVTQGKEIRIRTGENESEALEIKGVDLTSSMPGSYAASFAPEQEDYLRWLEQIAEMGANTVRVYTIMDADFYNAFYEYNASGNSQLYLLQGIQVSDDVSNGTEDAYHEDFQGQLIEDGLAAVDIIHGRRIRTMDQAQGSGTYFKDISPWVLGYLVGHEWNKDTIAYTDNSSIYSGRFDGEYFSTTADATAFEAMLAQVMERMMRYESEKYKQQRLIGFVSSPDTDFLVYEEWYERQLQKYVWMDAEHIIPGEKVQSGYFAAYQLYDFCDSFSAYLDSSQCEELAQLLPSVDSEHVYGGYLDLLGAYHTMPVIAAGFGFSSARGATDMEQAPLTEAEQGYALMEVWEDALEAGWSGGTISTWQDVWERRTWNTSFATELTRAYCWHDLQSDGENYGLMAYVPGEEGVCVVDGDPSEWAGQEPVLTQGTRSLYVGYDHECLYLLIQGTEVNPEQKLYIPFDMTAELGSTVCEQPKMEFDRGADFLLCLDGKENSRLLVQERYSAMRANFQFEIDGTNPYFYYPDEDSAEFQTVSMVTRNDTLLPLRYEMYTTDEFWELTGLGVWETGRLTYGSADPESGDHHSLADFYYGEDCVEIRLPWLLLNVADPTTMQIHQDYYSNYGVESETTKRFFIGLGDGTEMIELSPVKVSEWDWDLKWRERLKQSYAVVQQHWTAE